jgi:tripartite motif-containing protein 71
LSKVDRGFKGRVACLFAALLLCVSAAPVLADPPAEGAEEPPSTAEAPAPAPSASELAEFEREESENAEWLSSPEAEHERESSRDAYASLSTGEAQSLLTETFTEQLAALNADPARFLSELKIEEPLGTYGALVSVGEGESAIVESSVPVESDLGGEGKEPVDLSLEPSGTGFVPQNPLSEVELPGSAEESIQLQNGVGVELPASNDHAAETLGDKNLFIPETETATDTLIAPTAGGVEVFEQLRSAESPEQFRFPFSLPQGARVEEMDHGAEVLSASGEMLEEVPAPSAVDAQGTSVPVSMTVEGDSLVIDVPHRSADVAYPLLLDPRYNNGYEAPPFSGWAWGSTGPYGAGNTPSSLLAYSQGNSVTYGANTFGQWEYNAPGETVYMENAGFSPIYFYVNNCQTPQPHGYVGIYNVYSGTYNSLGVYSNGNISAPNGYFAGGGGVGTRKATVGIGTAGASSTLKCAHEMWVGGVTVQENDPENPTINSVTGIPSGWIGPSVGSAAVLATDPGFGVDLVSMSDGGVTSEDHVGCTGMSGSRCPRERYWPIAPPYKEGERALRVSAEDPTGKVGEWSMTTKVDFTKPEIILGGQLAYATEEEGLIGEENKASENQLSLPVYNLRIEATDGSNSSAIEKRSGVKNIEVFLDGTKQTVPWSAQECPASSCKMEENFQLKLVGLTQGVHKLKVLATDQVGLPREREIEFEYIPATGMKDEYVMQHFPLPDGEGNEAEEEQPIRPELAVNVMNGNLVYRQKDVEISGPAVDLEVERFYNSQLPKADNTEWGSGWTLAQTPKLEPETTKAEAPPSTALALRDSGAVEGAVGLPTESGSEHFDTKLQAVVTKEPSGGYDIAEQSGETEDSLAFSKAGQVTEMRTPSYAGVEYSYESGKLSEIAVEDPASTSLLPAEVEENPNPPAYEKSVGSEGSAGGQFKTVGGLARDSKGNLWVTDSGNARIDEFDESGKFTLTIGKEVNKTKVEAAGTEAEKNICTAISGNTCQAGVSGSGNGQFSSPYSLAIDPKGNVWVVELTGHIQEFNEKGEFLRKTGITGNGAGQFTFPQGIAADAKGNIWVADTANRRIDEFNEKAEFVLTVGKEVNKTKVEGGGTEAEKNLCTAASGNVCKAGVSGAANGQFALPVGITVDSSGNIWVADTENNRIQELSEKGVFIRQFGAIGSGPGQLSAPAGLAFDPTGNLWVADRGNSRIEEFSGTGEYKAQLGSGIKGSGEGQFSFSALIGLSFDGKGHIWISDSGNHRMQQWQLRPLVSKSLTAYDSSIGSEGSAGGQFNSPGGVARDSKGNLWVTDSSNARLEQFSEQGEFVLAIGKEVNKTKVEAAGTEAEKNLCTAASGDTCKAGVSSSANGQFSAPNSLAIDSKGNVWVGEVSGHIQEFNEKGEFLRKAGSTGAGAGQFTFPQGITVDPKGNVWVSDTANKRVDEFNEKAEFVLTVGKEVNKTKVEGGGTEAEKNLCTAASGNVCKAGASGTANGQYAVPVGITADSKGNLWISDTGNNRVQELNEKGEYVRQFGVVGSGNGQLKSPGGLALDPAGNLWVADRENSRIEEFNEKGEYKGQLGSGIKGSEEGQFSLSGAVGLAFDAKGHIWIADAGNRRVQQWLNVSYFSPGEDAVSTEDDPSVDVSTSAGLVTKVAGEEAGSHTYQHSGELLTVAAGPKGETKYKYDGSKRLIKVELPKATWGEITYESLGRVKSVTVSIEGGKAKTTNFTYSDEPRETVVTFETEPTLHYQIGADGSVLKWWNAKVPPEIEALSGSLYAQRGEVHPEPITIGDQTLLVHGHSFEGIALIQVVASGDQVVAEKTCEEVKCINLEKELVTNTANWPPGILQFEVIVTDRLGQISSQRFWDNIPYTPPPESEAPDPPTFAEILRFREESGLDLDIKGNEQAINERIFELIADWHNPNTPLGEVARSSDERWGAPMRPIDVAEMEYREQYIAQDIPILDAWARTNYSGSYAGVYVDERSGGLIRLGFTSGQSSSVAAAQQLSGLLAPNRIAGFPEVPVYSLGSLSNSQSAIAASLPSSPEGVIVSTGIEVEANRVLVGATNVAEASSWLTGKFGAQAPVLVGYEESAPVPMSTRRKISGPLYAGDLLVTPTGGTCSAGFGAMQALAGGKKRMFELTAAHCFQVGDNVRRENSAGKTASIGTARRSGRDASLTKVTADTVAVDLVGDMSASRYINQGRGSLIPVKAVSTMPGPGKYLCHSGYGSDPTGTKSKLCGKLRNGKWFYETKKHDRAEVLFCFDARIHGGDSGGPVWIRGTHTVVGLATHGRGVIAKELERETCATALLPSVVEGSSPMPEDAASLTNTKLQPLNPVYAP